MVDFQEVLLPLKIGCAGKACSDIRLLDQVLGWFIGKERLTTMRTGDTRKSIGL